MWLVVLSVHRVLPAESPILTARHGCVPGIMTDADAATTSMDHSGRSGCGGGGGMLGEAGGGIGVQQHGQVGGG